MREAAETVLDDLGEGMGDDEEGASFLEDEEDDDEESASAHGRFNMVFERPYQSDFVRIYSEFCLDAVKYNIIFPKS